MFRLSYDKPAREWLEALPLGNGRLGAMVYGEPLDGRIQMNEESVVYGGPVDRINPDSREHLEKIRTLIREEKIQEAEELALYTLSATPQSERPYQTLCDVFYKIKSEDKEIHSYTRELDLETGIAGSSFMQGNVTYRMEAFISKERDMLAVEFSSDCPQGISLSVLLTRGRFYNCTGKVDSSGIYLEGDLGKNGSDFCVRVKACSEGGEIRVLGEHLLAENADKVVLYINGVTTFPHRKEKIENCFDYLKKQLSALTLQDYEKIREKHIKRHRQEFGRSVLELETEEELKKLPVNERLLRVKEGKQDNGLISLYYAYGRYLMMACSQPGGLPANLQGIWCEKLEPIWDSKYTININTEMNYWLAEIGNLSECHEPLFTLLERMAENGKVTADRMYGCRGFVAHHNTDVWADTAPQDLAMAATYWVMGGAWLTTHIWKHYRYTCDRQFLKRMFPVLKACALFLLDFLVEDRGEMVICPSLSPENTYIMENGKTGRLCMSSTMDNAIVKDIFQQFLDSVEILGETDELTEQIKEVLKKLPGYKIGKYGQLMEWREDYEEWEMGHRHFSHIYPLFPSCQINEYDTPELVEACRVAIERRMKYGGGHTGWSCAWLINLYARLQVGDEALKYIYYLLGNLTAQNMFDMHPPLERIAGIPWVFQIDGNFGGACGIAQMLLQSHLDEIFLLPALPDEWKNGKITGICAEGGFVLDIDWKEGKLKEVMLYSKVGNEAVIRSSQHITVLHDRKKVESWRDDKNRLHFATRSGEAYCLISE